MTLRLLRLVVKKIKKSWKSLFLVMPNDHTNEEEDTKSLILLNKKKYMAKKRLLLRANCRFQKFFFALWLLLWHNRHQFYCQANGHLTPSKVGIASQQADLPPVNHMPLLPHIMPTFLKRNKITFLPLLPALFNSLRLLQLSVSYYVK